MSLEKIGRYEIKKEIGRGGMATVYQANDPNFERDVAVKILPHAFMDDPQFRKRFEREAKSIAAIEHSAIVPVHDFGEENGQPYIVMRLMTGGDLSEKIEAGKFSIEEAAIIIERISSGLDAAHEHGILHRDLKPGNIIFDRYENAHITDFGLARMSTGSQTLTGDNILGTPPYMSPEQIMGEELDNRSDLYSLGIIFYKMITGDNPYHSKSSAKVLMMHIQDPIPEISRIMPSIPPAVDAWLKKALAKDPLDRFSTAKEMSAALNAAVKDEAHPSLTSIKTFTSLPKSDSPTETKSSDFEPTKISAKTASSADAKGNRNLFYILGAVGVLILGGIGFLIFSNLGGQEVAPPIDEQNPTAAVVETVIPANTAESSSEDEEVAAQEVEPTPIEANEFSEDFSADLELFSTSEGISIIGGGLVMGEFESCLETESDQQVECLSVCLACGDQLSEFEVSVDIVYSAGISERLHGLILRFMDENENQVIDREDYFLGWVYSINQRQWQLHEHKPNQSQPWQVVKRGDANLRATPTQPNFIKVLATNNGQSIEVFMNDVKMVQVVSTLPQPGETYLEGMAQSGQIGFWVADRGIQVVFDNFTFSDSPTIQE